MTKRLHRSAWMALAVPMVLAGVSASAKEWATLTRLDPQMVELSREDNAPVTVWLSRDTKLDAGDQKLANNTKATKIKVPLAASERQFVILQDQEGKSLTVAERVVPLQQASNFRDIGGYVTQSGKVVKWNKGFRSGAMPLLTDSDYAVLGQLGIGNVVDLRSLDERELIPDQVDDRLGALFLSNDYAMASMMGTFTKGNGENVYQGIEKLMVPQYRAMFRRLMADDGAVLYHCSAGQDRTGIATAILFDVLGVDRDTIIKDYHLSTDLRRTQWEMPDLDPKAHPNNRLLQHYASQPPEKRGKAEPLYSRSGVSHLVQFFPYLDKEYGGSEGYLKTALGFTDADIAKLRTAMLD